MRTACCRGFFFRPACGKIYAMRNNIFIATFSYGAVDVIRENQLNIEINHTCISEELNPENREKLLASIRRDIEETGAEKVIVHGPFTEIIPAAIDGRARDFAKKRLEEAWEVCRAIGAEGMVVHTGWIPFMYFKEWQAEKGAAFWQEFMQDKPQDFRIFVENVLDDEPYMLANMMKQITDPRIGLCLDVGHALAAGHNAIPMEEWIRVLGPYLMHFHIHNNHGDRDAHGALSLEDGVLDFNEVFSWIRQYCRPDVTFTIESRDCASAVKWLTENGYI